MGQVVRGGEQFETAISLGQSITGTSDIIILTLQCSSSEDATGLIGWREVV